ncbi:uncharacterized protein LOC135482713 isoform X2 [Lineus longissimus]|uniref:uncharacterized protein LOC135482713 isoform X2 n=1 Tax=Lineus longissimus TaxID=88925 RepID=UPI002B4F9F46
MGKEIFSLKKVHQKEVTHLENLLKGCQIQSNDCKSANTVDPTPAPEDIRYLSISDASFLTSKPIGFIKSVFQFKNGTPRQPSVCQHSRGSLTIEQTNFNNPEHSLEGLHHFSHLWIIFVFHQNNNSCTKAKVKPPRLDGAKVGLFSTRCPYRPNPIGLSLAKIEDIKGATIYLSGIDILDGTPVLDIKPYIPDYDCPATAVDASDEDVADLNESQVVVEEEELSVLESEMKDILDSSNASFNGGLNGSVHIDSPNSLSAKKTVHEGLESVFSELTLSTPKDLDVSKMSNLSVDSSGLLDSSHSSALGGSGDCSAFGTPDRGNSSFSLNRSLEIVKDALCGSMVSDLNDSNHDPLDPLAIIHSVKEKMKVGQNRSPGNNSNDSGIGGSLNTTKVSCSQGYQFGNHRSCPGYSPGASFQFGSTPTARHSVSSVSDCDRSFEANEALLKLRRQVNSSTKPDLVLGKPTSQLSPNSSVCHNSEVFSVSDSDETLCSNYDDASLSRSSDSILANQKVTVNPSFRSVSPQLKCAGLGSGMVAEGGHPKPFTPIQTCQKKSFSPPSYPMSSDPSGLSSRMSPKLRRLYSNMVNSSTNGNQDEAENTSMNSSLTGGASPIPASQNLDSRTSVADWIDDANAKKELLVSFTQRAEKMVRMFGNESKLSPFKLGHLKSWGDLRHAIESVLKADPRSVYRREKCPDRLYYFTVDCAHITCWFDGNLAEVLKVQPMEFAGKIKS